MDKTKIVSICAIVIIVIALLSFVIFQRNSTSKEESKSDNSQNSQVAEDTKESMEDKTTDSQMDKEENMEDKTTDSQMDKEENTVRYQKYSKEFLAEASDKTVVLFYKATWCPSCKALDRDIKANLDSIPNDVLILEVAYDKASGATEEELELVERNDVTYQHTLMVVDSDGNKTRSVVSGSKLSQVLDDLDK